MNGDKSKIHHELDDGIHYVDVYSKKIARCFVELAHSEKELEAWQLASKRLQKLLNECNRKIKILEGYDGQ